MTIFLFLSLEWNWETVEVGPPLSKRPRLDGCLCHCKNVTGKLTCFTDRMPVGKPLYEKKKKKLSKKCGSSSGRCLRSVVTTFFGRRWSIWRVPPLLLPDLHEQDIASTSAAGWVEGRVGKQEGSFRLGDRTGRSRCCANCTVSNVLSWLQCIPYGRDNDEPTWAVHLLPVWQASRIVHWRGAIPGVLYEAYWVIQSPTLLKHLEAAYASCKHISGALPLWPF